MSKTLEFDTIQHQRDSFAMADDIIVREATVVPSGLNAKTRTVPATVVTNSPVTVYDPYSGQVIEEVLIPRGMQPVDRVNLLRDHNRYSVLAVLGDAHTFRATDSTVEGQLQFGDNLDADAEACYRRVEQGFLRKVSAGYSYQRADSVEIPPGGSAVVDGRTFSAGTRMMRVVKKWFMREVSLVVIPADEQARLRGLSGANATKNFPDNNPQNGTGQPPLPVSNSQPTESSRTMSATATPTAQEPTAAPVTPASVPPVQSAPATVEATRQATAQTPVPVAPVAPAADPIAAERTRQSTIRNLASSDIPGELVTRALDEGWSIEQTATQFANTRSTQRPAPLQIDQAPFGHTRGAAITMQALTAGLMMREGVSLDSPQFVGEGAIAMFGRCGAGWFQQANSIMRRSGNLPDDAARAFDSAHQIRHWSMVDFGRAICTLQNINPPNDPSELFERVSSTAAFNNLFTTSMTAMVLAAYELTPDPTDPFVRRVDVPNFLPNERIQLGKAAGMRREGVNSGEASHLSASSKKETYSIERFVGQMEYDEKAFINDQFNTLDGYTVGELGENARRIPADLVFGVLLSNPTMADGVTLFHASHGNVSTSAPFSKANLKAMWTAIGTQTDNGQPLGIVPQNLVVPLELQWDAEELLKSIKNIGGNSVSPEMNAAYGKFNVIGDSRLGGGVLDHSGPAPTMLTGSATTYYGAAAAGRHTIEVGYLRGAGKAPRIISKDLPGARIGRLYVVVIDCQAKALDWKGLYRCVAS